VSLIKIENISKNYYPSKGITQKVLREINLEIQKGEFVSIMGPSGSGKSTLMNILGCLDKPTSGNYFLNDKNISELESNQLAQIRRKEIGFVFQGFNLLHKRTVSANISMPLIYCFKSTKERNDKAKQLLKELGLAGYENYYPNQLSGGMQQRVAIARALINNPNIILADEPTGNLDSKTGEEVMNVLKDLNENKGITIILITHEHNIATYSKRLVCIKDGVKEFDGTLEKAKQGGFL